jgi:hypothetical protein
MKGKTCCRKQCRRRFFRASRSLIIRTKAFRDRNERNTYLLRRRHARALPLILPVGPMLGANTFRDLLIQTFSDLLNGSRQHVAQSVPDQPGSIRQRAALMTRPTPEQILRLPHDNEISFAPRRRGLLLTNALGSRIQNTISPRATVCECFSTAFGASCYDVALSVALPRWIRADTSQSWRLCVQ